ncbi:hypothetical protein HW532_20940 [Kaustia mangrovi]|uniref:HD domain-containing protein n=1 Tax=Kaustia mangrovi TaxID=2593653 RepID=A0A7S8C7T4_9HYPH|nr:hypothetical protein [Kaustia mangrovi]QPC44947.1 hypothetical protein HW532_20940 [Kaustia mangrovi]
MAAIRTKGGRLVDPWRLTRDDIRSVDFCHALSCINRYTGWAKYPYSVGQHSHALSMNVPNRLMKAALIHDFAEAFFNDLASPIKYEFPDYQAAEEDVLIQIARTFGVPLSDLDDVHPYDKAIYIDERNALFDEIGDEGMGDDRVGLGIDPWWLRERNWRDVYRDMTGLFRNVFYGG